MDKTRIRKQMRKMRRALTPAQRVQAGRGLKRSALTSGVLLNSQRLALYLVNDGEIDPQQLIDQLQRMGKTVYLPTLHPLRKGALAFVLYNRQTRMIKNRFGIPEPDFRYGKRIHPRFLDTVFMPLVAFDQQGNRLGMGGGFYDRTLAFTRKPGKKPRLIGCAHEFQCLSAIPAEAWDIPLSAIATDVTLRTFNQSPE